MGMSRAQILIVEDDDTLGKALHKALSREGFNVHLVKNPNEAIPLMRSHPIDLAIIDVLLSGMTGIDLAGKIREIFGSEKPKLILMSGVGVFTEKTFIREQKEQLRLIEFLKKPFELQDLLNMVNTHFEKIIPSPQKVLNQILAHPSATQRVIRRAIEKLEDINGLNLPFVLCLLVDTNSSGHINLVDETGEVSGFSLSNGNIVGVDMPDQGTLLGQLLIEKGFLSVEELEEALSQNNHLKIGQRLIKSNFISPHAFEIAFSEQLNVRLSRKVDTGMNQINFVPCEVPLKSPYIDQSDFLVFVHDWVNSKIPDQWIRSFYRVWGENAINKGPEFSKMDEVLRLPLFCSLDGIVDYILSGRSLDTMIDEKVYKEITFLKGIHMLLLKRVVVFGEKNSNESAEKKKGRLVKIYQEMQGKNHLQLIEMMGVARNAKEADIAQAYHDFQSMIQSSASGNEGLTPLAEKIIKKFKEAYVIVSDPGTKEQYQKEYEKDQMKRKFEVKGWFDHAKDFLYKSQGAAALELLQKVGQSEFKFVEYKIYLVWAKILTLGSEGAREKLLKEIESDLLQIPHEERHECLYAFVIGLHQKVVGNLSQAKKNFERAVYLNPQFVEAKRELHVLSLQRKGDKSDFDIKNVMGSLFGKKKTA